MRPRYGPSRVPTLKGLERRADITALPSKKRGRPVLLGQELDATVQMYLKRVREGGGAVSARIAMAAARGILLKCDPTKLAEFGGHVQLTGIGLMHS